LKIQTKIALLFTVLCTTLIIALSFAVYYFSYQNTSEDFYTRLELRAVLTAKAILEKDTLTPAYIAVRRQYLVMLPEENEYIIKRDTLDRFKNNDFFNHVPSNFLGEIVANGKATYRHDFDFYIGITYSNDKGDYIILVSAKNAFASGFLASLKAILIIACIISLIIAFSIGLFFSKEILAPVRNVTRQVNRISATSLHMRLDAKKSKDDIAVLTNTFNDMLNRLETAFETQNNFVSNASHELNTPLTAIIGEADYALAKPRSEQQYRQSLSIIMQQGERLQAITHSLVELARSGFRETLSMEPVDIDELVHNAKQNAYSVYSNCNIHIDDSLYPENSKQLRVLGNMQLLELALSNVMLNACKYSANQPVTIAVAVSDKHVIIVIRDNGIGIPDNEVKNIFDPFFRASNVQSIAGYGIGLPLTQNIIKLHKGTIEITSKINIGTEVIIKIPRV
jgi:signal transduction histidine kinase